MPTTQPEKLKTLRCSHDFSANNLSASDYRVLEAVGEVEIISVDFYVLERITGGFSDMRLYVGLGDVTKDIFDTSILTSSNLGSRGWNANPNDPQDRIILPDTRRMRLEVNGGDVTAGEMVVFVKYIPIRGGYLRDLTPLT